MTSATVAYTELGDAKTTWSIPLERMQYLGDPPTAFGLKALEGIAIRVDIAGERKIIWFTGEAGGEGAQAVLEIQNSRLGGGLDPLAMLKGLRYSWKIPQFIRNGRTAREAWLQVLNP